MSWDTVPLQRIASLESGFGFPREYQGDENQEFPFFRVSDMNMIGNEVFMENHSNTVSAGTLSKLGAKVFPPGTVIFPKIGAAIATEKKRILIKPATFDNNVMGACPKTNVNPKFLYYWFIKLKLLELANPGHVPSIRKSVMQEIPFPLVAPSEQSRIVELLEEADRLRRLRREADVKSARILPALFLKMFGDPAANPLGISKKRLEELIKVKSGNFLPAREMAEGGSFPVYGGNGVSGFHDKYMFEDRKIVLGRVGAYCGVVHYSEPKAWVTDNALYVSEKLEFLEDYYLVAALQQANLNQYAGRAGQPLISGSRINSVEILIPSSAMQSSFAKLVTDLLKLENSWHAASARLDSLCDLLMDQAFSGELTSKWREAHMKEIMVEMSLQARALNLKLPKVMEAI